jgi:hypothetical protein
MDLISEYFKRKELDNCCINPNCIGYEGGENETICPNCKSKLYKLSLDDYYVVLCKPNYLSKNGDIKPAIRHIGHSKITFLAPKDDIQ